MAKKNKKSITELPFFRLILTLSSTVLAVVVLTLSALVIINIYDPITIFLIVLGLFFFKYFPSLVFHA